MAARLAIASVVFGMSLFHAAGAAAQVLSAELSLDGTSYHGGARESTDGDRSGEAALKYEFPRGFRIGAGVAVGKFDEPVSDPSFTTVSVFVEPSWVFRRSSRVRPFVGGRIGWEHERVGEQSSGLWAYGWGAGGIGGVLVKLGEPVSVGGRVVVTGLDLDREGASRNGVRLAAGATLALTWPLR